MTLPASSCLSCLPGDLRPECSFQKWVVFGSEFSFPSLTTSSLLRATATLQPHLRVIRGERQPGPGDSHLMSEGPFWQSQPVAAAEFQ